jgi:hypothetical protein
MKRIRSEAGELPSTWADAFRWDGALRDVYVHGATAADWQTALDFVRGAYAPLTFTRDGVSEPLPPTVVAVLRIRATASPMLAIPVGTLTLNCHFFADDEIEFDVDPREVRAETDRAALVTFMCGLAVAVGRPVELTMENMPAHVFLRVEPAGPGEEPRVVAPAG